MDPCIRLVFELIGPEPSVFVGQLYNKQTNTIGQYMRCRNNILVASCSPMASCVAHSPLALIIMPVALCAGFVRTTLAPKNRISFRRSIEKASDMTLELVNQRISHRCSHVNEAQRRRGCFVSSQKPTITKTKGSGVRRLFSEKRCNRTRPLSKKIPSLLV